MALGNTKSLTQNNHTSLKRRILLVVAPRVLQLASLNSPRNKDSKNRQYEVIRLINNMAAPNFNTMATQKRQDFFRFAAREFYVWYVRFLHVLVEERKRF